MVKTEKGFTSVRRYDNWANYNADTERTETTISFVQQDQSIVVGGKRYSQNAECFVGSDVSGISTTGNWFLVGETTFSQYTDVNIIGSAVNTLAGGMGGLFVLNLRSDQQLINPNYTFQWLCKAGSDAKTPVLRYVINGMTIKLYCKVFGGQYSRIHIRIFNQVNRAGHAVHKESFFKLKDSTTIIPEADVPSGTDIADVPYLSKDGTAAQSTKVLQTKATASKERLVLLGETDDTTRHDSVYKSAKLTFNPVTETLTVPTIKNPNGSWAHIAYKTRGTVGYVKVATITINQTHADEPICFEIMQRQQPLAKLRLQYATAGNTNPPLNTFSYQGTSVNRYYIHQTGSGVWDLYIGKLDSWTAITVSKVYIGGYSNGYYQNPRFTITWQDELVAAVPEGSVAATKATEYVNISGNAATATKATQDGNGIVIAGNYQRVYKSSFHVTADGWYKLAFRPNTTGLLDWKDKYILVNVYNRQGGACNASFKILYSSQGGWMSTLNNEFLCIPLTTTNYACISNVRLLSKNTSVSGNSYIELYVQLSKGGDNASTDVEISIESNIPNTYLYNTATAGETDTSAYTVITRNARTAAYGGSLAVGGLIAEKALSANKLATPRSFNLGGGLIGTAVNFDGTGNVELEGGLKKVFSTNGNRYNYQYHRFLSIGSAKTPLPAIAQNYHFTFLVQNSETAEREGILDINLRTNGSTQNSYLDCKWLLLSSNNSAAHPKIAYGFSNNAGTTYVDLFIKHTEAYKHYHFVLLSFNVRAPLNVTSGTKYKLYNSSETDNTTATDKATSYEVYASIAQAGQEIHGHTTGTGYSIVKDDTILDNVATFVGGFVNGAKTANKLQTARKIGFADFNGTADVSLYKIQSASVTRWTSSGSLKPNQWIRLIRMKFIQAYSSVSITLAIEDIEQHRFRGLINFTAWVESNLTTSVNNSTAIWYSLYQADKNSFGDVTQYIRMVPIAPTDNDANGYVDVYVMSPLSAIQYGWHIINDRRINNASFTLKADVTTIIDNDNFPTSYKSSAFQGVLATGENVEYNTWVTKATTATNADVANKTKYPIVFKRNGASITNWFANTTFVIDIPEELLGYSAPTGIALKVPEIDVAKEAKKVANKLSLTVNGSTTEYDGSAGARVSIKANCTHIVKANSNSSLGILYPEQTGHPSAVTVPVSILPLEPYNSAARGLNDGDTLILHIPNSMSNPTANYVWCVKLDITKENATDNIIPLIHGQSAGTPAFWNTSTTIPAGFYQFVYSATLGGLIYMYRNTSTT